MFSRLSSLLSQWRILLASLTALALTIPLLPALSTHSLSQSFAPNVANVSTAPNISRNWSGYTATGGSFTSVTGTWTVPNVVSNGHNAADATWVGIGGVQSGDLIQSGTQDLIDRSGHETHSAFLEMLPNFAQPIPVTINSGDSITVSVTEQSTNQWQISFKDNTSGQPYTTTALYFSSHSSAEWIEEAPSNGRRILTLANFGTVDFSGGSTIENGNKDTLAQSNAQSVIMVNNGGQALAIPSSLASDGASFSITRSSAAR
jgi:Peptidase A4 family